MRQVLRGAGVVAGVALIVFGVGLIFHVGPDLDPQGSIIWIGAGGALVYWSALRRG
jgi:hypothetical protein